MELRLYGLIRKNMKNIKILKLNPEALLPIKGSEQAIGFDIYSNFYDLAQQEFKTFNSSHESFDDYVKKYQITLTPHSIALISTGLVFELPLQMEMDIKSRSSLFSKYSILAQGTIDPDYRGEVKIMLYNLGNQEFTIRHQERIAQAVFRKIENNNQLFKEVSDLSELSQTNRNFGGFGSTGSH